MPLHRHSLLSCAVLYWLVLIGASRQTSPSSNGSRQLHHHFWEPFQKHLEQQRFSVSLLIINFLLLSFILPSLPSFSSFSSFPSLSFLLFFFLSFLLPTFLRSLFYSREVGRKGKTTHSRDPCSPASEPLGSSKGHQVRWSYYLEGGTCDHSGHPGTFHSH